MNRVLMLTILAACHRGNPQDLAAPAPSESPGVTVQPQKMVEVDAASLRPTLPGLTFAAFPLPDATPPLTYDYLAYDRSRNQVWIPVGETGSVYVFDVASHSFSHVDGFKSVTRDVHGKSRAMGPSAVAIGDGSAYIGNRGTSEVCAVDTKSLALQKCLKLAVLVDGVSYVASAKEVWITAPHEHAIKVLDATKADALKVKFSIAIDGEPEGYAVDEPRGLFYTNLEDKNLTLAIDVKTHTVHATWPLGCGPSGPRGVAVDGARNLLMVACTDRILLMDTASAIKESSLTPGELTPFSSHVLESGAGVDNIDYDPVTKRVHVAAGASARMTVASVSGDRQFTVIGAGATARGARNGVADAAGNSYVVDPNGARLLVFPAPER